MNQPPPDILSADWWSHFRRDVFQLVAWGYQIEEAEIRRQHLEPRITGLIRKGINTKLDEGLPPRFQMYSAHNEDPVDDNTSTMGNDRPRVDVLIECSGSRPRRRYRLEAKRCARTVNPIGWYTSGIDPYLDGRYAQDAPEAGLLGLVQSDSTTYWKDQLVEKLRNDTTLNCVAPLSDEPITVDLPGTSSSQHTRCNNSPITLLHAFLDCRSDAGNDT